MQPLKKWLCFRLETGVKLAASIYLALMVISAALLTFFMLLMDSDGGNTKFFVALLFLSTLIPGFLLFGAIKKTTWALWPFLVLCPINWIQCIIYSFEQPLYLLNVLFDGYNWLAVWSLRQEFLNKQVSDADSKVSV